MIKFRMFNKMNFKSVLVYFIILPILSFIIAWGITRNLSLVLLLYTVISYLAISAFYFMISKFLRMVEIKFMQLLFISIPPLLFSYSLFQYILTKDNLPKFFAISILFLIIQYITYHFSIKAYKRIKWYYTYLITLVGIQTLSILSSQYLYHQYSPFLNTYILGIIMIGLLYNEKVGYLFSINFALYALFQIKNDYFLSMAILLSGLATSYYTKNVNQRIDATGPGLSGGAVFALSNIIFHIINGTYYWRQIFVETVYSFANGFGSVFIVLGILPYIEEITLMCSNLRFIELGNLNNPLLRELSIKAKGTYNHSVNLANLVEPAANAIGANSSFIRVAAYYHDVGKMNKPEYFTENQENGVNPHKSLSPYISASLIINHTKNSIELAKKYKLPYAIREIMKQHHGTRLVQYFYNLAASELKDGEVQETSFRYDGPKPQTKEAAITMLADVIEAKSKSIEKYTHSSVKKIVDSTVTQIFEEGELDESGLTVGELNKIKEVFVKTLMGMYHKRISYENPKRS